jgi:hypothetical protein
MGVSKPQNKLLRYTLLSIALLKIARDKVGLYRTSCPVRKSGEFSKSGLSGNWTFSFPDAGLLTLKNRKKNMYFLTFTACF